MKQTFLLLVFTASLTIVNAQVVSSRLIAINYQRGSAGIYINGDSEHFVYKGNRGGDLNTINKINAPSYNQTFTNNDTLLIYNDSNPDSKYIYSYDNNNNLIKCVNIGFDGTNYMEDLFFYDAQNNDTLHKHNVWSTSANYWIPYYQSKFTYTPSNQVATEIDQEFKYNFFNSHYIDSVKINYYYDMKGNVVSNRYLNLISPVGYFLTDYQWLYTFDSLNELTSETYQYYDSVTSTFINSFVYSYYYKAGHPYATVVAPCYGSVCNSFDSLDYSSQDSYGYPLKMLEFYPTGIGWDSFYRYNYTYNSAHQISTIYFEDLKGNSYNDSVKSFYAYNKYAQLTNFHTISNKNNFWHITENDVNINYYYEDYTTGIKNATLSSTTPLIFPNPASQTITIQTQWASPQATSGVITDVTGRVVARFEDGMNKVFTKTLSVEGWAAGVYFLKLNGEKGESLGRFEVR